MIRSYLTGLILSLLTTLTAFGLAGAHVWSHHLFPTHEFLIPMLMVLAICQLVAQLVFFLHAGRGTGWDKFALTFAVVIVVLFVGGTLWIMAHLQPRGHEPFDGEPSPQHEQ